MHGIVGKVNNNALLLQTMLYLKWGHAVMNEQSNVCLFQPRFQDSILVSCVEPLTNSFVKHIG